MLSTKYVPSVRRPGVTDKELENDVRDVESHRLPTGKASFQCLAEAISSIRPVGLESRSLEGDSETYGRMKWLERFLLFPDSVTLWRIPSLFWLLANGRALDIKAVWSSSGPETAHLIGLNAKTMMKVPLVVDFRDLWVDDPYKMFPTSVHRRRASSVERSIVHKADSITVVGEEMKRILSDKYDVEQKTVVIRNGFDAEDILQARLSGNVSGGTGELLGAYANTTKNVSLVYMGSMHDFYAPAWDTLLLALAELRAKGYSVSIESVGYVTPRLRQRGEEILGERCVFHGYLPHARALEILLNGNIAVLLLDRREGGSQTVTGKVYELLASGLPILCIAPKYAEGVRLVLEHQRGMVCEPESDISDVVDVILKLASHPRLVVEDAVKQFEGYSRRTQAAELAQVLNSICSEQPLGN